MSDYIVPIPPNMPPAIRMRVTPGPWGYIRVYHVGDRDVIAALAAIPGALTADGADLVPLVQLPRLLAALPGAHYDPEVLTEYHCGGQPPERKQRGEPT